MPRVRTDLAAVVNENRQRKAGLREKDAERKADEIFDPPDRGDDRARKPLDECGHGNMPAAFERKAEADEDQPGESEERRLLNPGQICCEPRAEFSNHHVREVERRHAQQDNCDERPLSESKHLHKRCECGPHRYSTCPRLTIWMPATDDLWAARKCAPVQDQRAKGAFSRYQGAWPLRDKAQAPLCPGRRRSADKPLPLLAASRYARLCALRGSRFEFELCRMP